MQLIIPNTQSTVLKLVFYEMNALCLFWPHQATTQLFGTKDRQLISQIFTGFAKSPIVHPQLEPNPVVFYRIFVSNFYNFL